MGFAASQARLMGLISRKSDLELQSQMLQSQKIMLANITNGLFSMQSNPDMQPGSDVYRMLEARIRQLSQADKLLDMRLKSIDNEREATIKQIDSVEKIITKNIEMNFGTMK